MATSWTSASPATAYSSWACIAVWAAVHPDRSSEWLSFSTGNKGLCMLDEMSPWLFPAGCLAGRPQYASSLRPCCRTLRGSLERNNSVLLHECGKPETSKSPRLRRRGSALLVSLVVSLGAIFRSFSGMVGPTQRQEDRRGAIKLRGASSLFRQPFRIHRHAVWLGSCCALPRDELL